MTQLLWPLILTWLMITGSVALAQESKCSAIKNDQERLSCYDDQAKSKTAPKAALKSADPLIAARAAIAKHMKDPDSTRIRNSKRVGDVLCGTYNAKNSYGGYGTLEMFVFLISKNRAILINPDNNKDFDEGINLWKVSGCEYKTG